jgi:hypothetical protein
MGKSGEGKLGYPRQQSVEEVRLKSHLVLSQWEKGKRNGMWLVIGVEEQVGNVLVRKLLERGEEILVLMLPGELAASKKKSLIQASGFDSLFALLRATQPPEI